MAPEQVTGETGRRARAICSPRARSSSRCSRAGRRSAAGRSSKSSTPRCYEQPPALTGLPGRRGGGPRDPARARQAARRPAAVGGRDGRGASRHRAAWTTSAASTMARPLTRLVVLPFRVLRPDPETDFLAFSLPDAIATSLSGIGSLIVRSSAVAARFAGDAPDLKALAAEADVDRVVMGTLLRVGRSAARRGAARRGAGRHAAHVAHGAVVAGRSVPAAGRHRPARRRGARRCRWPAARRRRRRTRRTTPRAYELYLRANELARTYDGLLPGARPVRALPRARPAVRAGVGPPRPLPSRDRQVHRGAARQRGARRGGVPPRARAEPAARRSRTSSTRTSKPTSARRSAAVVRLLGEADASRQRPRALRGARPRLPLLRPVRRSRSPRTPKRAGSIPNVPTSLDQTLLMAGDIDRLLAHRAAGASSPGPTMGFGSIGLGLAGRRDEARAPAARDAPVVAHPALPDVDRLPDWRGSIAGADGDGRPPVPRFAAR